MKEYQVTLTKGAKRQIRTSVVEDHFVNKILVGVNNKRRAVQGYRVEPDMIGEGDLSEGHSSVRSTEPTFYTLRGNAETGYQGEVFIKIVWVRDAEPMNLSVVHALVKGLDTKAGQYHWELSQFEGEDWTAPDPILGNVSEEIGYANLVIPEDFESHFAHLIGFKEKVEALRMAIEAYILTNGSRRENLSLIGPPGCGKSDLCSSLKRALGEEAVIEFDATNMTAQGIVKTLEERTILPRIAIFEEIEKSPKDATNPILALADQRAEIRKNTYRENVQRDVKMLCICTVNSKKLFDARASGALADRFSNPVYFSRPSREMLAKILEREILKIDGNFAWIEPILDWCDKQDIVQPRRVISLMYTYRDAWITTTDGVVTDAVRILTANLPSGPMEDEEEEIDLSMFDEDDDAR